MEINLEYYEPKPYCEEQLDLIAIAEECGLTHTGEDENGVLQFVGNEKAWEEYEKKKDELGLSDPANIDLDTINGI